MSTYKGPLKKDVSGEDLVKDSNSLSLAGQLLRRHKVVTQSLVNLKKKFQRSTSPPEENEAENVAIKIRSNPK